MITLLLLLAILGSLSTGTLEAQTPDRASDLSSDLPNVLLITVDTLRADHLSSYGYHLKTSPRMDQLAGEGVRFEQAHSVIPLTGPSHISLFTSRYPQEHGARINGTAPPKHSKWLSLPQVLKRFGYHNAAFVSSWTLISRLTRLDRWFDSYEETLTRTYQVFNSSRYAEDVTPLVLTWLERNRATPFFLWVHYFDPHSPYHLREEFASPESSGHPERERKWNSAEIKKRIRKYNSEIGYTDHHIGRVLDKIDRMGLRESTLVVLTSDHGESLGEHGYVGHNKQLYQGIIRVPLILRLPGRVPAGKVIDQPVSLLDVTPTIIEMVLPEEKREKLPVSFAGSSLAASMLTDVRLPNRPMRYLTFSSNKGFLPKWFSWMWTSKAKLPLRVGKTDGTQKLVWFPEKNSLEMVELSEDPWELNPETIAAGERLYKRETARLESWFESTDLEESEVQLSERDTEVLKSLGYIQ